MWQDPEQRAEHAAIHERLGHGRTGPGELVAKGEIDEPVPTSEGDSSSCGCLVRSDSPQAGKTGAELGRRVGESRHSQAGNITMRTAGTPTQL